MKKPTWVFLYKKYSKFWSVSLEHFIERKPLIYEEQCTTEAGKYRIYRIPKLRYSNRTEPNNTEPNLIVDENQYFPLFDNFFQFYCIFMWQFFKTCSILLHFSASKRSCFKQIQKFWGKNVQMIRFGISVSYRTEPNRIIPNRSFGIR